MAYGLMDPSQSPYSTMRDLSAVMSLLGDMHPCCDEVSDAFTLRAEEAKGAVLHELARIADGMARHVDGEEADWRDAKPLFWLDEELGARLDTLGRVAQLLGDHFTVNYPESGAPLSETSARGLGVLMEFMAASLAAARAGLDAIHEELAATAADEAREEQRARFRESIAPLLSEMAEAD